MALMILGALLVICGAVIVASVRRSNRAAVSAVVLMAIGVFSTLAVPSGTRAQAATPCPPGSTASSSVAPATTSSPSPTTPAASAFAIASPAWSAATIAQQHACANLGAFGSGTSPAVSWTNAPAGTRAFALKIMDTDATFNHWVVINIPTSQSSYATGASGSLPAPAQELQNDFGDAKYGGPCPPPGQTHHYVLTVYALSRTVADAAGIAAASLASDSITGLYTGHP
jgi:Raf kinase inhibitor-like YbhB/YbcL family protein